MMLFNVMLSAKLPHYDIILTFSKTYLSPTPLHFIPPHPSDQVNPVLMSIVAYQRLIGEQVILQIFVQMEQDKGNSKGRKWVRDGVKNRERLHQAQD